MSKLRTALAVTASTTAVLALSACGDSGTSADGDSVTVQLDYEVRGNHAMFYVAKENGYFKDEGIEVDEIKTGSGSPDTLRMLGSGGADFGFADLPSLVTARSEGVPVTALAAVNQESPLGMCSLKDNADLSSVEDLEGLRVGVHPAGSTYIFYQALMAINDVDRDQVDEVTVTPPYENYLIEEQVDSVICYIDAEVPLLEDAAGGEGSLNTLLGAEHGYDAYGSGLFTSEQMIEEDPDLVQGFTNAYLRAFEFAMKNPDKAAQILTEAAPELADKKDLFTRQLQADIDHTFTSPATKANGLGAMEEDKWQATIDILADQDVLKGETPEASDVYDSTFVDSYNSDRSDQ